MSGVACSNCSATLPERDLHEGWCNSCGQRIPMFVYHSAGLKGPKEKGLSGTPRTASPSAAVVLDADDAPARWQLALIGAAMLGIAAVIVLAFV